jgi:hypothetical protein
MCGHMFADPSYSFAMLCRGCSVSRVCSVLPCSSMLFRSEIDSLYRELVVCHSAINAHVSRMRPKGDELWSLNATYNGCGST